METIYCPTVLPALDAIHIPLLARSGGHSSGNDRVRIASATPERDNQFNRWLDDRGAVAVLDAAEMRAIIGQQKHILANEVFLPDHLDLRRIRHFLRSRYGTRWCNYVESSTALTDPAPLIKAVREAGWRWCGVEDRHAVERTPVLAACQFATDWAMPSSHAKQAREMNRTMIRTSVQTSVIECILRFRSMMHAGPRTVIVVGHAGAYAAPLRSILVAGGCVVVVAVLPHLSKELYELTDDSRVTLIDLMSDLGGMGRSPKETGSTCVSPVSPVRHQAKSSAPATSHRQTNDGMFTRFLRRLAEFLPSICSPRTAMNDLADGYERMAQRQSDPDMVRLYRAAAGQIRPR